MRKVLSLILVLALLCGALCGCDAVGEIAGGVAEAAKAELEKQIKETLGKYKVEIVELKTAVGKLNDDSKSLQFFCAALVKAESDALAKASLSALNRVFEQTGIMPQTGNRVESPYLVHKEVVFDHEDFSDGTYYTIYAYNSSLLPDGK